jgi:hypothetical protein
MPVLIPAHSGSSPSPGHSACRSPGTPPSSRPPLASSAARSSPGSVAAAATTASPMATPAPYRSSSGLGRP